MADSPDAKLDEGKLDLVPMIDCIMLLLLFFIVTTRFVTDEQRLAAILPDQGQSPMTPPRPPVPQQQATICIYPAGMERGLQPSQYAERLRELRGESTKAWLRVGGADPLEIDLASLQARGADAERQVARVHAYLAQQLARFEVDGGRHAQCPVTIHCFSGLAWAYAVVAYDGCRAYEKQAGQAIVARSDMQDAREIDFAAPRLRDSGRSGLGDELFEIVHLR